MKSKTRKYIVEADVLWHGGKRYEKGAEVYMTPLEARWLLGQQKIKPAKPPRKRRQGRVAEKSKPKGDE